MKKLYENKLYEKQLSLYSKNPIIKDFENKSILISGATGLICSNLIDILLFNPELNIKIYGVSRSSVNLYKRFSKYTNDSRLVCVEANVVEPFEVKEHIDYIIHGAAGSTDSVGHKKYPVECSEVNYEGTRNLLKIAKAHNAKFLLMSSTDVYVSTDNMNKEDDFGAIDFMKIKSAYVISKAASENLVYSYASEYGLNVNVARISHAFGPTVKKTSNRALESFIKNGLTNGEVELKSIGNQTWNNTMAGDAGIGLLYILAKGKTDEVYNVNTPEYISLKEIADFISNAVGAKFVHSYEGPSDVPAFKALQDNTKLTNLGWSCQKDFKSSLKDTIDILKDLWSND